MKSLLQAITILLIASILFGQNKPIPASPGQIEEHLDRFDLAKLKQAKEPVTGESYGRGIQNIVLDYEAIDNMATIDSGGIQQGFIWRLHSQIPDDANHTYELNWAVVAFDSLVDANSLTAFDYSTSQLTIDSIWIFFSHDNITGTLDSIVITVYEYPSMLVGLTVNGITLTGQKDIANMALYTDMITTTTSLAPISGAQLGTLVSTPNLTLNMGQQFAVGVHFYGHTANDFYVYASYKDLCLDVCGAEPSVFPDNSMSYLILWENGLPLSGFSNLPFIDCDLSGGITPGGCELLQIQNLAFVAFATIATGVGIDDIEDLTDFELYPNPTKGTVNVMIELNDFNAVKIEWYNILGVMIMDEKFDAVRSIQQPYNLSSYAEGIYFAKIIIDNSYTIRKIILTK